MRLRCQKGIPPALRGRAWLYLSGGKVKKEQNKGKFQVREASLWLPFLCYMMYVRCSLSLPFTAETVSTLLPVTSFFFHQQQFLQLTLFSLSRLAPTSPKNNCEESLLYCNYTLMHFYCVLMEICECVCENCKRRSSVPIWDRQCLNTDYSILFYSISFCSVLFVEENLCFSLIVSECLLENVF